MAAQAPASSSFTVMQLSRAMPASCQFILYGMEFKTDLAASRSQYTDNATARREFDMLRAVSAHAVKDLPTNRELINSIRSNRATGAAAA